MVKSVGRQMSVGRCVCVCVVSLRAVHCIASRNIFVGKLQFINDGIWQRWPKKELVHPFHGYTCQGRIFWYCYFYPCIFFCCHTNFPVQIFGVFAAKPAVIYYFTSILMRWPFFINKYIFVIKTHFFSTFMLRIFIWYFQNFSTQKTFLTNNKILNDFFLFHLSIYFWIFNRINFDLCKQFSNSFPLLTLSKQTVKLFIYIFCFYLLQFRLLKKRIYIYIVNG